MRRLSSLFALIALLCGCVAENPADTDDAGMGGAAGDATVLDGAPRDDGPADGDVDCRPKLSLTPGALGFPRGPAFEEQTQVLMLQNTGACTAPLQVALDGSRTFRVRSGETDLQIDPSPLADPDRDGTPGLAAGAELELTVVFTPTDAEPQTSELLIRVEGGEPATYRVALTGNNAGPCVDIEPSVLEFESGPDEVRRAQFTLRSCGDAPATIQRIFLGEDSDGAFSLAGLDPLPLILAPADAAAETEATITVEFVPGALGTVNGTVFIESDGLPDRSGRVQLVGRVQENVCPVAVVGDDAAGMIGDVIVLDGSASRDPDGPDGRPVEWVWRVIERPDGSAAAIVESLHDAADPTLGGIQDDTETPEALFVLDAPGRYLVELEVIDVLGLSSAACETNATFAIRSGASDRLQFQLTWETPGDPNPNDDNGADVDLVARFGGVVCNAATPTPDWAPAGPENNPVLDGDDRSRGGPENIVIATPAEGSVYEVVAEYDDPNGLGPSIATIRVFLAGALVAEQVFELEEAGDVGVFEYRLP